MDRQLEVAGQLICIAQAKVAELSKLMKEKNESFDTEEEQIKGGLAQLNEEEADEDSVQPASGRSPAPILEETKNGITGSRSPVGNGRGQTYLRTKRFGLFWSVCSHSRRCLGHYRDRRRQKQQQPQQMQQLRRMSGLPGALPPAMVQTWATREGETSTAQKEQADQPHRSVATGQHDRSRIR